MIRRCGVPAAFLGIALLGGCARVAPLPPATPELPVQAWESAPERPREAPPFAPASTRPETLAKTPPLAASRPPAMPRARTAASPIPGGAGCLAELATRSVRFSRSEPVLGIATPVRVEGVIGGVRFYTLERKPFVVDCRLVLALAELAGDLRELGVSEARYSGAYVYRTSQPGRMSLHAYGLAIDLHEFKVNGASLDVKTAFERGGRCTSDSPLNALACRVRERRLFHEQLGPDDNADHHDHFHLGLRPLPGEVGADLPWPRAAAPRRRVKRAGSLPEVTPSAASHDRKLSPRVRSAPARRAP